MKNEPYLAYCHSNFKVLGCHPELSVLCDYLHISQPESFTICPVLNEKLFEELTTVGLYKIYLSLGGDKTVFRTAEQIMQQRLRLLGDCRRLAVDYPVTKINGFEAGLQAGWIDRQEVKCGYRYLAGSHTPQKVI